MKLNIDQIHERIVYRYKRSFRGVEISGQGVMVQKYKARNGWHIILHDARNKRAPTLRLNHILGPARVR